MQLWELFLAAISLSMDAFAVSICKGLAVGKTKLKHIFLAGAYFGLFQAIMPLTGYFLGHAFRALDFIEPLSALIAFVLLAAIGINMIREACKSEEAQNDDFSPKAMLPLAVATSIDALAVGVSYSMLPDINITTAVTFIGATTFVLSAIGVKAGAWLGSKFRRTATIAGGCVLIILGLKILAENYLELLF